MEVVEDECAIFDTHRALHATRRVVTNQCIGNVNVQSERNTLRHHKWHSLLRNLFGEGWGSVLRCGVATATLAELLLGVAYTTGECHQLVDIGLLRREFQVTLQQLIIA